MRSKASFGVKIATSPVMPAIRTTVLIVAALAAGCDLQAIGVAPSDPPEPETQTAPQPSVPAGVGVGKKGRSLDDVDGVGGVIAQPARSLFATKERVVFEIQIPHALNLYKALNGKGPKSHKQFMSEIVDANKINLPELPEGRVYRFDPETQVLMVDPVTPVGDATQGGNPNGN